MQKDLLVALNEVEDPELGIGIVDLGLIHRADWGENGIEVEFTMTSPTCPFGELLTEQIEEVLRRRFREAASIAVRLVWDTPWTLEQINEAARRKLGWVDRPKPSSAKIGRRTRRLLGFWTH
jgi:metal-sulfur cluster biosynthetic enzyme